MSKVREVARLGEKDRKELFRATAQAMEVHEAIIEKDFWVCWVLDFLFSRSQWKERLAFKGGTSLSKAYAIIERFSEDIDLILDWEVLGYSKEPWQNRSITQQNRFSQEANRRAACFLADHMGPDLSQQLSEQAGTRVQVRTTDQDVLITYPRAFSLDYILPEIRLEIGPLAAWVPNDEKQITPYAAERFPVVFSQASTGVRTILAERTFWEKATILHQEAHRTEDRPLPAKYSRHYYDVHRLCFSPVCVSALERIDLLEEVVEFKARFYHCSWAKYEEARPGSLKLLPPDYRVEDLRRDYRNMQAMLFGQVPTFEDIMRTISRLESSINGNGSAPIG